MKPRSPKREIAFLIHDLARQMRTYADQRARQFGMTRAQWAVLAKLEQSEGLKQAELAEMLDIQPITLTRLIDRLHANGLIERRADPADRRAKRLYLTDKARPLMDRLADLAEDMMGDVLHGFGADAIEGLTSSLNNAKNNLRDAMTKARANAA
jgi:MarR family transcriptional regulator for hemolysin